MAAANPQLKSAVGRSAVNHSADVRLIQKLLNDQTRPPLLYLKEDGRFGHKTASAIRRFQTYVCKMQQPTERIDPGDATLAKLVGLHNASVRSPVASDALLKPSVSPATKGLEAHADVVREEFSREHREAEFAEFWKSVAVSSAQSLTAIFGVISRAEDARTLAVLYLKLRRANFSAGNVVELLKAVAGAGPKWRRELLETFAEPTSKAGKFLKSLKNAGEVLEFVWLVPEVMEAWDKGEWGKGAASCYKFAMGKLVPWGGLLDYFESICPDSWKGNRVIKLLRVLNPVGLGGVAVDSVVTCINVAMGSSDERELDRLVERMKEGPARIFAEFGEDIADVLFKAVHRNDKAFMR